MNKEVITISKNISIRKVCEIFRDNSIRHLVIVDGQSQAAGIFTLSDLMRALGKKALVPDSSVAAIMSSRVWQVEPGTTARYALSLMARHAISGVVVVKEGKPLGFFTERDVVRMITGGSDLMHDLVGDVLTSPAVCLSVEASPREAAALMQSKSVRRLVILDSQAEIAGILTKTDLSRSLDCCQLFGQPPLD